MLNSRQTTESHTRLFHIGLSARDVLVIESMFRFQPALAERYVFGAPTAADPVDLVLVNADDHTALTEWERHRAERPELIAVMVSENDQRMPGHPWIRRPLDLRNIVGMIETLTSGDTGAAQER